MAIVREHHDDLRALAARLVDPLLHAVVAHAEAPVRHHVARIGDRRVRKRLADHGHLHAVHLLQRVGWKDLVLEVGRAHVLRDEIDAALEVLIDDFPHPLHAESHLPVGGHHVDAEQLAGVDHVLRVGPQRRARALPGVATVQQQRAGAARLQALHQGGQVRETADLAVGSRRRREVEIGEGMRLDRLRRDVELAQQVLADQVRRLAQCVGHAEVDARLAKVDRQQLRMAVGEVQEVHVAEAWQFVHPGVWAGSQRLARGDRHAGGGGHREQLQEFATVHRHLPTLCFPLCAR